MAQVLTERDGHTMVVTMNRPQRMNAMTLSMFFLLEQAWKEASADDERAGDRADRRRGQLLLRHGPALAGR